MPRRHIDGQSEQSLPGNPFSGLTRVLKSPYLLGISSFVALLATITTFLYFEQARLVAELFPDRLAQIRVFGMIDVIVQAGALFSQLFLTGRLAERLGVRMLLAIMPLLMCIGLIGLSLAPSFIILTALMSVRRIGEYTFTRPGREMLFAPLAAESKYKAKSVIDTVVYRAGDAISGWVKSALDMLGQGGGLLAVVGTACVLLWGCLGWRLGKQADESNAKSSELAAESPTQGLLVERAGILQAALQRKRGRHRHLLETHILRQWPSRVFMYYKRKKAPQLQQAVCRQ